MIGFWEAKLIRKYKQIGNALNIQFTHVGGKYALEFNKAETFIGYFSFSNIVGAMSLLHCNW